MAGLLGDWGFRLRVGCGEFKLQGSFVQAMGSERRGYLEVRCNYNLVIVILITQPEGH